ncbi:L,D-transpeptidase family protein [Sphingobium sufflavum]|uniref:L,D-transpeptidase family protein n=1 Tax=Sphingobium sufflavum TaxID=1129547 RepID=UPI001F28B5AE|nr:L,D-transpeptidase family protein [Sphingobium sufflavum]MCE7797255.1 L,D-transpeptidase family protein [Sphingobium sufflavum]
MKIRLLANCLILSAFGLNAAASARAPAPVQSPSGQSPSAAIERISPVLKAQVLLDRAGFAPGALDGRQGHFLAVALTGFQQSRGLPATGQLDDASWSALNRDYAPTLVRMILKEDALAENFTPDIPGDMMAQAALPYLGYRNLLERLAERFHTTPQMLLALNPALKSPRAGMELVLPGVIPSDRAYAESLSPEWRAMLATLNVGATQPVAAKIVVVKSHSVLKAYDAQDRLVAQFPATMGSEHDPLPIGNWIVKGTAFLPTYHYNPELFWDASEGDKKAVLPPGPNNPVGVVWIDLDKPHYGIHGTPEPSRIGRSQSHGCIRLSNWDVARLAQMISPQTPVLFRE